MGGFIPFSESLNRFEFCGIRDVSDFKLKSYYYALNESVLDIDDWMSAMVHTAVSLIPDYLKEQPVILSADDTMTEKTGEHFECCSVLFDHAAHNDSSYGRI